VNLERDCKEPETCVVVQIARQLNILRSDAPQEQRAMALKFVGHFVGDVHQPLHVSYAADRGGNRIRGEYFGKKRDMHGVWDFQIIEATGKPWQQIASELRRSVAAAKRRAWGRAGPTDWANESLTVTLDPSTQYAGVTGPYTLGQEYQAKEWPVAADRLARAGVRLGKELNEALSR
jgi:S1/P1 Nuclease